MSKSKYTSKELWNERYGKEEAVYDYAGRLMLKSACGNANSQYEPTIDHIRPLSAGGKDVKQNIILCHWETNAEKADAFPHWKANGKRFHARRNRGNNKQTYYEIVEEKEKRRDGLCLALPLEMLAKGN